MEVKSLRFMKNVTPLLKNANFKALYEGVLAFAKMKKINRLENLLKNFKDKPEVIMRKMNIICPNDIERLKDKYKLQVSFYNCNVNKEHKNARKRDSHQ